MDWYSDCKRISKQEVIENLAEVERLCQSQDIRCWCSHSFERMKAGPFSTHCTDLHDTPMIRAAWRWLLCVPGLSSCDWQRLRLFNFSQTFVCQRDHGSSAAVLEVGSVRVTILHKNPTYALVIPLLVWKFFCNPSTSVSCFYETHNNNRQLIYKCAKRNFSA